jgi:serine/threonine-protein kinase RsbW
MDRSDEVELQIPAKPEYVGVVRLFVSALATARRELPAERIDDLKLVVSEATTNAIESYDGADVESPRVLIRWRDEPDRFEVRVVDSGRGFDLQKLTDRPPVTDVNLTRVGRGLGIPLIRALVDDVVFERSERGTTVRLYMECAMADLSAGAGLVVGERAGESAGDDVGTRLNDESA